MLVAWANEDDCAAYAAGGASSLHVPAVTFIYLTIVPICQQDAAQQSAGSPALDSALHPFLVQCGMWGSHVL